MSSNSDKRINHPLGEVFGFPPSNFSDEAKRYRKHRLCPYNNKVPSCTKDRANDPLGVCSVYDSHKGDLAITCPIRFREQWLIAENAAEFFFPPGTKWTSLAEVRLNDKNGSTAGNIDLVLVACDDGGKITDFGALEVQAVYISGNIRRPYQAYIEDPESNHDMNWTGQLHYPRADYLSSSRKRLVPQLIYKGQILREWGKKIAVALHAGFFRTLFSELYQSSRGRGLRTLRSPGSFTISSTISGQIDIGWSNQNLSIPFSKELLIQLQHRLRDH